MSLSRLAKFSLNSLASRCLFAKPNPLPYVASKRFLFSADILGLEGYKKQRTHMEERTGDLKEQFRTRMEEYMNTSDTNTIFTDDLRTMVHIAHSDEDLDTAAKMMKRFHSQSGELRFSQFQFGPVVMRLLYLLDKPDLTYELFMDEALSGFFDQMSTYRLAMDLLFESGQLERCMEVFSVVQEKNLDLVRLPMDCVTIAIAACYQMNTAESFLEVKRIIQAVSKQEKGVSARAIVYSVMFALKQDQPNDAFEILSLWQNYPSKGEQKRNAAITNIKTLVLTRLGRLDEAVMVLRSVIEKDYADSVRRNEVFAEVLTEVEGAVAGHENKELQQTCSLVANNLRQGGYLMDSNLEVFIMQTIYRAKKDGPRRTQYHGVPDSSSLHQRSRRTYSSSTKYSIMKEHENT